MRFQWLQCIVPGRRSPTEYGGMFKGLWSKPDGPSTVEAAEPLLPPPPPTQFIDEYIDETGDRRVQISEDHSDDGDYEHGLPASWFSWKKLWRFTGPGFLMSIAYLVCTFGSWKSS